MDSRATREVDVVSMGTVAGPGVRRAVVDPARAPVDRVDLLMTITRCWPAVGGAEIHTRELLRAFGHHVAPIVAAHWDTNRTDWLLGTTLRAPRRPKRYD